MWTGCWPWSKDGKEPRSLYSSPVVIVAAGLLLPPPSLLRLSCGAVGRVSLGTYIHVRSSLAHAMCERCLIPQGLGR